MTLKRRIFFYFFGIYFLVFAIIGFFQYQREKQFRTDELDHQLATYNYSVHRFIEQQHPDWDQLEEYVHIFPDTTLRVTVIDTLGVVQFDSFVPKGTKLQNHLHRPEVVMSNHEENGKAIRHSVSTGRDYYYLAHHFTDCYVRSALPYNVSLTTLLKANTLFINFMGVILLLSVIALYIISRSFTQSIERLRIFTQKAEKGEIPDISGVELPNDELGEITRNIVQLYTMQLETRDELYKEREKLITHLQISQEGLGIFSSDKKEILVNSVFVQYINIISDEHIESSGFIFGQTEFEEISRFIDENLKQKRQGRKRVIIEKGGRVFSAQCIVFPDDTFEVSINDITVQEHENELKRHLTQNISHELKTPVSSILGYMESILSNPDLDPQRQKFFIERSFQQAQRLSALLQDISTLNKMDEGRRLFENEICNIAEIISDVLNDVHLEIENKGFVVQRNFGAQLPIAGNRSLIYSIFRNLLDNTLAYAGENITVDINCYREDEQYYYFSFSDNGIGVAEEHLNRLFERFYRVDKGRSRKMGGTGLGLAIVKNAVIFHRGVISAKNIPNGGLSFLFSLRKNA